MNIELSEPSLTLKQLLLRWLGIETLVRANAELRQEVDVLKAYRSRLEELEQSKVAQVYTDNAFKECAEEIERLRTQLVERPQPQGNTRRGTFRDFKTAAEQPVKEQMKGKK